MKFSFSIAPSSTFIRGFLTLVFIALGFSAWSTHNRAGEIIYERIQGDRFRISIITFTEINNNNANRDTLELVFGDGSSSKVARTQEIKGYKGYRDIAKNVYTTEHTYPGPGTYLLSVLDPNRNGGVINIPNSIERKFYIESYLNITLGESNNSAILTRDPIAFACRGVPFYYNPGAFDPDGDSLHFEMVPCKADFGLDIPDYQFPDATNIFEIDPATGILTWDSPITAGEYNVAIRISEWRDVVTANGTRQKRLVGNILRDMQITVYSNCSNRPPDITPVPDYCVQAGDTLDFRVSAFDSDGDLVVLNAYGGPMIIEPTAIFSSPNPPTSSTPTGRFYWQTDCNHVRKNPYNMTFEAVDDGFPVLANYQVSEILVVAPPVRNVQATAASSNIQLTWEREECSDAIGYQVYRRSGPTGFVPDSCETGVPEYLGYTLLYTGDDINELEYIDNNFEQGLIPGVVYCYLVVAYFADGAESYASEEICTQVEKDVPILTNVDVRSTDLSNGTMFVAWSKPNEHDTTIYPGPYRYRIQRTERRQFEQFVTIDSTESINDTTYNDSGLNTLETEYTYRIEMIDLSEAAPRSMGTSVLGTSVFLRSVPKDNKLILNWNELVPWRNYTYVIYKQNESGTFDSIASTTEQRFTDSNLTNLETYCYKVVSEGEYSLPSISKPLINSSQEHCNQPIDLQAPCAPELSLFVDDCAVVEEFLNQNDHRCKSDDPDFVTEVEKVELEWTNPNLACDTTDDVDTVKLYYSPVIGGEFSLLYFELVDKSPGIVQPETFTYLHQMANTRAGCYYVTAVDSFGNVSPTSDTLCTENCLIYSLPNVFTPNNDGFNDLFRPFPYCYVEEVEMTIFNRWGNIVFETKDPEILWDGINSNTNEFVPEGVYFYTCIVKQISVEGFKEAEVKGTVTVLGTDQTIPPSN